MVLDVFVEGCDDSFSCRYGGFTMFKCQILRGWNQELGELYEKKYGFIWGVHSPEEKMLGYLSLVNPIFPDTIGTKINEILEEYDKPYNIGMKYFEQHSDCEGDISPDQCVLLLKSFGRVDTSKFKEYEGYDDWFVESYDIWIKMMTYAIENDKSILFG